MQIKILQYVFYVLMCFPILALGFYFFLRLCKDIRDIKHQDKKELLEQKAELERRRVFEEEYSKKRNG